MSAVRGRNKNLLCPQFFLGEVIAASCSSGATHGRSTLELVGSGSENP
jgi:hypothetical protein